MNKCEICGDCSDSPMSSVDCFFCPTCDIWLENQCGWEPGDPTMPSPSHQDGYYDDTGCPFAAVKRTERPSQMPPEQRLTWGDIDWFAEGGPKDMTLEYVRELALKATPGPWKYDSCEVGRKGNKDHWIEVRSGNNPKNIVFLDDIPRVDKLCDKCTIQDWSVWMENTKEQNGRDAEYIAYMDPSFTVQLIDRIVDLEKRLRIAEKEKNRAEEFQELAVVAYEQDIGIRSLKAESRIKELEEELKRSLDELYKSKIVNR